jgi:hypothetical protein
VRYGLVVFGLAPVGPFRIFDNPFWPGLPYPLPGIGLDCFDDRKFFRPPFPLGHKAILLGGRSYGIPVQVWNTSNDFGGRSFFSSAGKAGLRPMEERDFFDEKSEQRKHTLTCPHCGKAEEYEVAWLVRRKKAQLPGRADERDRARFAKAQSYMVRKDDVVGCKNIRCRKRFEVSSLQSVAFI